MILKLSNPMHETLEHGFLVKAQGLEVTEDPSKRDWENIGRWISEQRERLTWALVDWVTLGVRLGFIDKTETTTKVYERAAQLTGYSPRYIADLHRVGKAFPPERRLGLSVAHHFSALLAPEVEQVDNLKRAIAQRMSANEFREYIQKTYETKQPPSPRSTMQMPSRKKAMAKVRCPFCSKEFNIKGHKVKKQS